MRFTVSAVAALLLAACASTPSGPAPSGPAATTLNASRALRLLSAAGEASAPTRAEIEHELGQADIARQDGAGLGLTYRLPSCALLLLFAANERNEMRLREAHVSARRADEAPPSLEQCATEASTRG
jgi:hypothetical protein